VTYLKWPFLAAVVTSLVGFLYWIAPNVRHPGWRWIVPGRLLALAIWIAASVGFTLYVDWFGSFSATNGSIESVIVFLLWLWLANIAILVGAELNAELERTRAIEGRLRPRGKTPFLPLRNRWILIGMRIPRQAGDAVACCRRSALESAATIPGPLDVLAAFLLTTAACTGSDGCRSAPPSRHCSLWVRTTQRGMVPGHQCASTPSVCGEP
jgi:hypothetical protein